MNRQEISPTVYGLLQHCQPTTTSVERSCLMLSKLLAKNRNFCVRQRAALYVRTL